MPTHHTEQMPPLVSDGVLNPAALPTLLSEQHVAPLGVLDLDSTLFDTVPRNRTIMQSATQLLPAITEVVATLSEDDLGWGVAENVAARAGLNQADSERLTAYWRDRFFSSSDLVYDVPYPGAAEFVQHLRGLGIGIIYLSGRDTINMRSGTIESLVAHGFPTDTDTSLLLKPDPADDDLAFKKEAFRTIRELGTVVLAVENEPANANALLTAFPSATVLLIDTITAPDPAPLDPEIIVFDRYR